MADKKPEKITFTSPEELPRTPMSFGSTAVNYTGSWKYFEPYYEDLTPPCIARCLMKNDIVNLMRLIQNGQFREAAEYMLTFNPFPATLGRVCPHPCETPCNRKAMGGAVRIQSIERFVGDMALDLNIQPEAGPDTGKHIAIIGGGPAGLSAAYFLRLNGHRVTVFERSDRLGGLLWSGIPPYRLERQVMEQEIQRILKLGINVELNKALGQDFTLKELKERFDAVILAIGLGKSRSLGIEGEDHPMVYDGIRFLEKVHRGERPEIGSNVIVVGGGNTAMDCARTALRLGAQVIIVYRRTEREMPAFKEEIKEAREEGVQFEFLTQPKRVLIENGKIMGLECIRMKLGERDASGRPRPVPVEGSEFFLKADTVIKALGETLDMDALKADLHELQYREDFSTDIPGVYAIGDCTGSGGTVGEVVRMGREVAQTIHEKFSERPFIGQEPLKARGANPEQAKFKMFNASYFTPMQPVSIGVRPPEDRIHDFNPFTEGLTPEEARYEAERCFKCGTCNMCGNCELFCPDAAIRLRPDGQGYMILYEYCKGCGVCVEECPRAAIHFRPVVLKLEAMNPER